jgi:CubicO group peptidase (beta-lactamase class C family)
LAAEDGSSLFAGHAQFRVSLEQDGNRPPSQKVFQPPEYPWQGSSPPADARLNDITVQQLLDHREGFSRDASGSPGDVVFEMRQISQKLGSNFPPSIQDFVAYMRGFHLDFTPDTEYQYSNVG